MITYAPARDRVLKSLEATAQQAFDELAPVVRQLVAISEQRPETGTPAQLAHLLAQREYRNAYERLLNANGQAQLAYWRAVKHHDALAVRHQQHCDMLAAVGPQLGMRRLLEAVRQLCDDSTNACETARKRKRNATPRQLCERRAACVGTVAAAAPPVVVVENNAAQLCADQSGDSPPM